MSANICLKQASLAQYTTFGVPASASLLYKISSISNLLDLVADRGWSGGELPLILGGGSNVLFVGDYPGSVLVNEIRGIDCSEQSDGVVELTVGGGENWHELVMFCNKSGYAGIENLALIPGSVGAAPIQNIGAYGVELSSVLKGVQAVNLLDGRQQWFDRQACELSYRDSYFKCQKQRSWMVTSVSLLLNKRPNFHLEYRGLEDLRDRAQQKALSLMDVSERVMALRRSKLPDPAVIGNAGSFFKNPLLSQEDAAKILRQYPGCPQFPAAGGLVKVSAAWLLEQCGWKGVRCGDAGVSELHALVLVNHGGATGGELWSLAQEMIESVLREFRVSLQPEVRVLD